MRSRRRGWGEFRGRPKGWARPPACPQAPSSPASPRPEGLEGPGEKAATTSYLTLCREDHAH